MANELVQVGRVCSKADMQETYAISKATHEFLRKKALELFKDHPFHASMIVWMCDGWSGPTCSHTHLQHAEGVRTTRQGKCRREYHLEHGFVRIRSVEGHELFDIIPSEARPLTQGRGAWHVWQCREDFLPPVRELGCKGMCVAFTVMDGALYSATKRHLRASTEAPPP